MPPGENIPPDQQINDDLALSLSNPFFGGANPFKPEKFTETPKDKIAAAILAVKDSQQLQDAVTIDAKAKMRQVDLAQFDQKIAKDIAKNKLYGANLAENILTAHDVRSPSENGLARNQMLNAMVLTLPLMAKNNKNKDEDLKNL